jgi:hypothetical protein
MRPSSCATERLLCSLLTGVACVLTAARATDLAPGSLEWYWRGDGQYRFEYSELEATLYRFEVAPRTPDSGINAGYVIAYGHPLPRPYRFSVVDDTLLYINGVQIQPWLKLPAISKADRAYSEALLISRWTQAEFSRRRALVDTCAAFIHRLLDTDLP